MHLLGMQLIHFEHHIAQRHFAHGIILTQLTSHHVGDELMNADVAGVFSTDVLAIPHDETRSQTRKISSMRG